MFEEGKKVRWNVGGARFPNVAFAELSTGKKMVEYDQERTMEFEDASKQERIADHKQWMKNMSRKTHRTSLKNMHQIWTF